MRIAIVGAGAIGCYLGARLSEHGHQVTLIGAADQVAAITRQGLLLHDAQRGARRYWLPAAICLDMPPDLVLLTVKTRDVTRACAGIAMVAARTPVIAMQNGVRGDRLAAHMLGQDNVLGAVVMAAATYLRPGEVTVQFPGWLILGEPFRPVGARTHALAATLGQALPTYVARHLVRARWSKLIGNLNNALCAATGMTLPEITSTSVGRLLAVRLMREGYHVARATGVRLDHGLYGLTPRALRQDPNAALAALLQSAMTPVLATLPEPAALALIAAAGRSRLGRLPVRFSTWQSIARGKPSEIEYLNGEVVRLGQELGVPTPYNSHLTALVREVERSHAFHEIEALQPPSLAQPVHPVSRAGAQ
jgi:2-dehydropantoate 2-reductase